ncbi:MAG: hypothetical protein WKF75_11380 [Singulisphaera sp.]
MQFTHVLERIPVHSDEIGVLPGLDRPYAVLPTQQLQAFTVAMRIISSG